jgi:proline iminopeptidase
MKSNYLRYEIVKENSIIRDGFKLRYYIEGEGIPVLICGSAIYYKRVFSQDLSNYCKMIYFDNRVFGGTCLKEMSQSDFEPKKIYDDIEALRQHLNLDKIVIIGHSGQAYMALEYAKHYPNSVSHVVMIGRAPTSDDKARAWAESNWHTLASDERKAALQRNLGNQSDEFINGFPAPQNYIKNYLRNTPKIWFNYDFDAESLWNNVELNIQGFNYIWGELFPKLDITKGLEDFNIPVAVMLGKYDGLVAPPTSWDAVQNKFKQLNIFIFDKSGHTPPLEEPALFNERLLQFLEMSSQSFNNKILSDPERYNA